MSSVQSIHDYVFINHVSLNENIAQHRSKNIIYLNKLVIN